MIFPLHAHAWSMCSMYVWGYSDGLRVVLVRCQETKELPTKKEPISQKKQTKKWRCRRSRSL